MSLADYTTPAQLDARRLILDADFDQLEGFQNRLVNNVSSIRTGLEWLFGVGEADRGDRG